MHINQSKIDLVRASEYHPKMEVRVDDLIRRPVTRVEEFTASKRILAATTAKEIIEVIDDVMQSYTNQNTTEMSASEGSPLTQSQRPSLLVEHVLDVISLHRLAFESLNRLAQQSTEARLVVAAASHEFILDTIEVFRSEVDVVTLGLQLINEFDLGQHMDTSDLYTLLMDCIQFFAPASPDYKPRKLPKRLQKVGLVSNELLSFMVAEPVNDTDAAATSDSNLAAELVSGDDEQIHNTGDVNALGLTEAGPTETIKEHPSQADIESRPVSQPQQNRERPVGVSRREAKLQAEREKKEREEAEQEALRAKLEVGGTGASDSDALLPPLLLTQPTDVPDGGNAAKEAAAESSRPNSRMRMVSAGGATGAKAPTLPPKIKGWKGTKGSTDMYALTIVCTHTNSSLFSVNTHTHTPINLLTK
jgi:hypothetical protein